MKSFRSLSLSQQGQMIVATFTGSEQVVNGVPDTGDIKLTVNGYTIHVPYGVSSTASGIAAAFGGLLSQDTYSPVWAKAEGATLKVISRTDGPTTLVTVTGSVHGSDNSFQVLIPAAPLLTPSFYVECSTGETRQNATCKATLPFDVTGNVSFMLDAGRWASGDVSGGVALGTASIANTYRGVIRSLRRTPEIRTLRRQLSH